MESITDRVYSAYKKAKTFGVDGDIITGDKDIYFGVSTKVNKRDFQIVTHRIVNDDLSLAWTHRPKEIYCEDIVNTQIPFGKSLVYLASSCDTLDCRIGRVAELFKFIRLCSKCVMTVDGMDRWKKHDFMKPKVHVSIDAEPGEIGIFYSGTNIGDLRYKGNQLSHRNKDIWLFKDDKTAVLEKGFSVSGLDWYEDGIVIEVLGEHHAELLWPVLGKEMKLLDGFRYIWELTVNSENKLEVMR